MNVESEASEILSRATHLALALDAGQLGSWEYSLCKDQVFLSERLQGWLGLASSLTTGPQVATAIHPDDIDRLKTCFRATVDPAQRQLLAVDCRLVAGAQERWVHVRGQALFSDEGKPLKVLGIAADITERVREDEAVRRATEYRACMFEQAPDTLLLLDLEGRPLSINEYGRTHLEIVDFEGIHKQSWCDWWSAGYRARARDALQAARRGETTRFIGLCITQMGTPRWYSVAVTPFCNSRGEPEQLFVPMRDTTHLKEIETRLQRQANFAQQLLGIVSHDLRNPISAIKLSADMLARRANMSKKQHDTIARISNSAERAERLIHDLLDITQTQLGESITTRRQRIDIHESVLQIVEEVRAANPLRVIELTSGGPNDANVDPDRIGQVVTNLLTNALQYSPADSTVRIDCHGGADGIQLRVHNHGPPIAAQLLPHLFDMMQRGTSERSAKGSLGLGLFIVKKIVDAHSGTIEVNSTAAAGTSFVVRLPPL